jgi:hypothetical protein
VSYGTTASFVAWLAERWGWPAVLEAYAWGDLERAMGTPPVVLAEQWVAHVRAAAPIPVEAAPVAARRFSALSLFEKPSPHWVPLPVRLTRAADRALRPLEADTSAALRLLERALDEETGYAPALVRWADLRLHRGEAGAVVARMEALYSEPDSARASTGVLARWADALALTGREADAHRLYDRLLGRHRLLDAPLGVLRLRLARLAVAEGSVADRYGAGWAGAGGALRAMDQAQVALGTPGADRLWQGYRALSAAQASAGRGRWAHARDHARASVAWFVRAGHLPGERLARHHARRAAWLSENAESALRR